MEPVIPDFAGKVIVIAKIDYGFYLWTADSWEILLAGPVQIHRSGGPPTQLEVDVPDGPLPDELADVVGSTITQLLVAEDGHLGVQIGDLQLSMPAATSYEAWQIGGRDGELLICMPGGKLSYFPPVRRDDGSSGSEPAPADGPAGGRS
jgi:Family of unknown function (DUF6188)